MCGRYYINRQMEREMEKILGYQGRKVIRNEIFTTTDVYPSQKAIVLAERDHHMVLKFMPRPLYRRLL